MATNVAPAAPGVIKVQFQCNIGPTSNVINRLFYKFTGTIDSTYAQSLATAADQAWNTHISPYVTQHVVMQTVTVTDLIGPNGVVYELVSTSVGTITPTGFLPTTTCAMSAGVISRRYRGGKPRWYQSGFTQADLQDNQHWSQTFLTAYNAGFNSFASQLIGHATNGGTVTDNINLSLVDGYTWTEYTTASGKVNYRKDPIYRSAPVEDRISTWNVRPVIATQRRRSTN